MVAGTEQRYQRRAVTGSRNGSGEPPRRRRVVVGLAAEAAAQAERARRATGRGDDSVPNEDGAGSQRGGSPDRERELAPAPGRSDSLPVPRTRAEVVRQGTCRCGSPATATCAGVCGNTICGEHLLNRASRLAWPGPYRSEREHTAYLHGFWANAGPLCTWCREAAGAGALAALSPVAPLPGGALERLAVLLRHPHDYPRGAWEETVHQHGGACAVVRSLARSLYLRKQAQHFEGRKNGDVLTGVSVGRPTTQATYELVDGAGAVWTVRPLGNGMMRKRRAWAWEPTPEERVAQLLPRIVELAAP